MYIYVCPPRSRTNHSTIFTEVLHCFTEDLEVNCTIPSLDISPEIPPPQKKELFIKIKICCRVCYCQSQLTRAPRVLPISEEIT